MGKIDILFPTNWLLLQLLDGFHKAPIQLDKQKRHPRSTATPKTLHLHHTHLCSGNVGSWNCFLRVDYFLNNSAKWCYLWCMHLIWRHNPLRLIMLQ